VSALLCSLLVVLHALCFAVAAQTGVQDIFGRSLNQRGITLVDWDGYMANPLIKFYVIAPTNGVLPGSATLTANGARLYFDTPGNVSASGPGKTISLASATAGVVVRLSVFPDRDGLDEDYALTIVFTGANNARQTNTVPIHVIDQDIQRTNDFVVSVNFDLDNSGFFTNATRRALVKQAADDWAYFLAGMSLDPVPAGAELTYIWSNNFNGGYYFSNTNNYTGYLLYAYGTTNSAHRSGGEGSFGGGVQKSAGSPLGIKRSGGFEAEIYGNYNTLGWLLITNDNDWFVTGNLGNQTNDFYSIAHHEIGHALIFNSAHPGFNAAKTAGAFASAAITNYYGARVPIDPSDHLNGAIDPESGQGAFGYEYYGNNPRKRWVITKLDLVCAREVGYVLRPSSAFASLSFPAAALPNAAVDIPFSYSFAADGGIPLYDWAITAGALPPGLALDPFTGALTGTPATNGAFAFTVRVRDYHEGGAGLSQRLTMTVEPPPPVQLALSILGQGTDSAAQLVLLGTAGQRQVIQASGDLRNWTPLATNASAASLYQFFETNRWQFSQRFYRAVVGLQPY